MKSINPAVGVLTGISVFILMVSSCYDTAFAYDATGSSFGLGSSASDTTQAAPATTNWAALSADGTYLLDRYNQPLFLNGDTAWSLIAQVSKEDAEYYLENRKQKGFNFILVNLIEHNFAANAPRNYYGDKPFNTAGDFNSPNEAYFAHADWVINKAAEKGIIVLLNPIYLGVRCGREGWCVEVKASSLATMRSYGRYLGNRYKNSPNIIWSIGADVDPRSAGVDGKLREFVLAIKDYDTAHLMTAQNGANQSARGAWPNESWLNLNSVYTYGDSYSMALEEYNQTPFKPSFLLETYYENEHGSTPLSLRRQAYNFILSGGYLGHLFGNCPLWAFNTPNSSSFCTQSSWKSALNSTGSQTLAYVGALFNSRSFYRLAPDQNHTVMTAGYQSGSNYAAAARTSDGSSLIAYIPTSRTVTMDMTKVAGATAKAWWFKPRNKSSTLVGEYAASGTRNFTTPDSNDWVLVIDNASLNLPAPGKGVLH